MPDPVDPHDGRSRRRRVAPVGVRPQNDYATRIADSVLQACPAWAELDLEECILAILFVRDREVDALGHSGSAGLPLPAIKAVLGATGRPVPPLGMTVDQMRKKSPMGMHPLISNSRTRHVKFVQITDAGRDVARRLVNRTAAGRPIHY